MDSNVAHSLPKQHMLISFKAVGHTAAFVSRSEAVFQPVFLCQFFEFLQRKKMWGQNAEMNNASCYTEVIDVEASTVLCMDLMLGFSHIIFHHRHSPYKSCETRYASHLRVHQPEAYITISTNQIQRTTKVLLKPTQIVSTEWDLLCFHHFVFCFM